MKTILITGASSGIGRALAVQAARAGFGVYAVGRNVRALAALAGQIGEEGGTITTDVTDISDPTHAPGLVGRAVGAYGHIDILVNNAGAVAVGPIATQTDEALRLQFGTHVLGPLALTREALPALRATRGHVFMLGSGVARVPVGGLGAYPPSKAALRSATSILRRELEPLDIAVTYVDPGAVDTGFMTRAGMPGAPRDVLVSPEAVARKILIAVNTRPRVLNVMPLQSAAVALGEMFPQLAEAVIERNPALVGAGPTLAAIDIQRDNNGRGEKIALPTPRSLAATPATEAPPEPPVPAAPEPEPPVAEAAAAVEAAPEPPAVDEPAPVPEAALEPAPVPEAALEPAPVAEYAPASEAAEPAPALYAVAEPPPAIEVPSPPPPPPTTEPLLDLPAGPLFETPREPVREFGAAEPAAAKPAAEDPERQFTARWQYEPPEGQVDEAEASAAEPPPPPAPESEPLGYYSEDDEEPFDALEPHVHHDDEPAATTSGFDAALESLQRRMERANLSADFVRSLLVPDSVIDVGDAAMRWAGMPNKHERALTGEVCFALAEWGFLAPRADGRYRVLRAADDDSAASTG